MIRPILLAILATFTLVTQARAVGYWGRMYDPNLQRWMTDVEKLPCWQKTQGAVDRALGLK